ncbi:MAG: hypothetical protein ACOY94_14925 [Bacillota bacterium]
MTYLATRKSVEDAVDQYFSGKISVDEAFRRAYGPDPRTAQMESAPATTPGQKSLRRRNKRRR